MPVYFWFPVLGCFGMGFIFMNIPPVANQFMELFGVGYGGLAFFLSALFWTHSAFQVPAGLIIDRIGTLRAFVLSASACTLGCLLPLLAPSNLSLAVAMRLLLGLGSGMLFLTIVKIVKILCPPAYIARAQGLQGASVSLGTMAPYLILPLFGSAGWAAAYGIGALFSAALLFSLVRVPLEPLRASRVPMGMAEIWAAIKIIAGSRHIWYLGCCHGLSYGSLTAIGSWLPSILADAGPGSSMEDWGIATGVVLLAGTAFRVASGDIGRLMPRRTLISRLIFLIGVAYAALAFSPTPHLAFAAGICLAAFCGATYASLLTLTLDVALPSCVATAVGFMNMVANFVNVGLILLFGTMREYTGSFSPALCLAGACAVIISLWGHKLAWPGIRNA